MWECLYFILLERGYEVRGAGCVYFILEMGVIPIGDNGARVIFKVWLNREPRSELPWYLKMNRGLTKPTKKAKSGKIKG